MADKVNWINVYHHAKCCSKRSNRCWAVAIQYILYRLSYLCSRWRQRFNLER